MKQQILVIHGGHPADTYQKYLSYLKGTRITLSDLRFQGWKATLQKVLGNRYEVFNPRMPNAQMAKYREWKIWFEKIIRVLDDNVILIGHSLGGVFLAKYLSEKESPKKIRAIFLVAAPYFENKDFALPATLKKLMKNSQEVFLYHSRDDKIVSFQDFEKYRRALSEAKAKAFTNRGHLHQEKFPEIVEDIKSL